MTLLVRIKIASSPHHLITSRNVPKTSARPQPPPVPDVDSSDPRLIASRSVPWLYLFTKTAASLTEAAQRKPKWW